MDPRGGLSRPRRPLAERVPQASGGAPRISLSAWEQPSLTAPGIIFSDAAQGQPVEYSESPASVLTSLMRSGVRSCVRVLRCTRTILIIGMARSGRSAHNGAGARPCAADVYGVLHGAVCWRRCRWTEPWLGPAARPPRHSWGPHARRRTTQSLRGTHTDAP